MTLDMRRADKEMAETMILAASMKLRSETLTERPHYYG